jgi:hypothetical protein
MLPVGRETKKEILLKRFYLVVLLREPYENELVFWTKEVNTHRYPYL